VLGVVDEVGRRVALRYVGDKATFDLGCTLHVYVVPDED
jgi:hypothetical protein